MFVLPVIGILLSLSWHLQCTFTEGERRERVKNKKSVIHSLSLSYSLSIDTGNCNDHWHIWSWRIPWPTDEIFLRLLESRSYNVTYFLSLLESKGKDGLFGPQRPQYLKCKNVETWKLKFYFNRYHIFLIIKLLSCSSSLDSYVQLNTLSNRSNVTGYYFQKTKNSVSIIPNSLIYPGLFWLIEIMGHHKGSKNEKNALDWPTCTKMW